MYNWYALRRQLARSSFESPQDMKEAVLQFCSSAVLLSVEGRQPRPFAILTCHKS